MALCSTCCKVPLLTDSSILDHWKDMIYSTLVHFGLEDHIRHHYDPHAELPAHVSVDELTRDMDTINFLKFLMRQDPDLSLVHGNHLRDVIDECEMRVVDFFQRYPVRVQWQRQQAAIILMIKSSLGLIRDVLIAAGWNPDPGCHQRLTVRYH